MTNSGYIICYVRLNNDLSVQSNIELFRIKILNLKQGETT